jgi:hypothetical protein
LARSNYYIVHKLAHALAGCVAASAVNAACRDGAVGAAVGEMVAQAMPPKNGIAYSDAEKNTVMGYAKIISGGVAAYAGGNAQTAINSADTAVTNNAFVPIIMGLAWLANTAWTVYQVSEDIAAIRDGKKTVEQVVAEKGTDYVANMIIGNVAKYSIKIVGKYITVNGKSVLTYVEEKVSTKIQASELCSGSTCFVAGTLVQTSTGLKPIETFVGGELVWSRNDQTGQEQLQSVMGTVATPSQKVWALEVKNEAGQTETITASEEHPFWVETIGWQKTTALSAGQVLRSQSNAPLYVVSVQEQPQLQTVYNIEVQNFHTYHVGELGVWVHNADCCKVTNAAVGQSALVKQKTEAELVTLFDKTNPKNSIALGGKEYNALPSSNPAGTTKIFDTSASSAAALEKDVFDYASRLTGNAELVQKAPGVWAATLADGTAVNVRNVSKSEVSRWTIDLVGNTARNLASKTKVEIKFQ